MAENESILNGSERVEAAEIEGETPVLDVHVPHATHTWKDFWIHLATIAIGLLIAISLEQSVEWMHHRHQRHQLQDDLVGEAQRDHAVVQGDLRTFGLERVWLVALRDTVDRMRASGGKLKLAYQTKPLLDPETGKRLPAQSLPSDAVWSTAKESQLVELLPRTEAEMYARHAWQHELLVNSIDAWLEELTELKAFENRFEDGGALSTPDLSRMTPGELDQYSALLSKDLALRDRMMSRLNLFDSQTEVILAGGRTEEELVQPMRQGKIDLEK